EKKEAPSMLKSVTTVLTPPWLRKGDDKTATVDAAVKPPEFPGSPKETATARNPSSGLVNDLNPNLTPKAPPINLNPPRLPPAMAREQARKLIDDGYRALQANDLQTARQCADQAKALRPDLNFDERNPDRLLADIQRKAGGPNPAAATQATGTPADAKNW